MIGLPVLTLVTFTAARRRARHRASRRRRYARPLGARRPRSSTWVVSLLLVVGFDPHVAAAVPVRGDVDWIPLFGIQYKLGVDGLSLALVVLTTTLTWISILASFGPIKDRVKEYMISFLILEVGMIGVFLALDMFLFYIFWEIVLVPMYLIIGIWGGANRIYATIKFVLYTLVGSLLMLVAILATAFAYQAATRRLVDGRLRLRGRCATLRLRPDAPALRLRSRSSWPSRSRSRCSRSTPGCPTPTSRRRPRAR